MREKLCRRLTTGAILKDPCDGEVLLLVKKKFKGAWSTFILKQGDGSRGDVDSTFKFTSYTADFLRKNYVNINNLIGLDNAEAKIKEKKNAIARALAEASSAVEKIEIKFALPAFPVESVDQEESKNEGERNEQNPTNV